LSENPARGNTRVQIVASGPDSKQPAVMQQYIAINNSAKESIFIANPYFILGTTVIESLKIATLDGITISLLIPKKSDSLMARYSIFFRFEELLSIGVKIYLRTDFLDSKVILIDNKLVSVGSGNFDHRSFEHNFEANALVGDEAVVMIICKEFIHYFDSHDALDKDTFKNRSILHKFFEGLAKLLSPLL